MKKLISEAMEECFDAAVWWMESFVGLLILVTIPIWFLPYAVYRIKKLLNNKRIDNNYTEKAYI